MTSKAELKGRINVISWHVVKYVSFYGFLDSIKGEICTFEEDLPRGLEDVGSLYGEHRNLIGKIFWNDRSK